MAHRDDESVFLKDSPLSVQDAALRTETGGFVPALPGARITVHLDRIEDNVRTLASRVPGLSVVGVTKSACGDPSIARALVRGGAVALADSRLPNLAGLRAAGIKVPLWLLRAPAPAQAGDVVRLADVSLESELVTIRALDAAARAEGVVHDVICMVEVGDLREGLMPKDVPALVAQVVALDHVRVAGLGVNLSCYGGIVPDRDNLGRLAELAGAVEAQLGRPIIVSGGNSSTWPLALAGGLPAGITSVRSGESILQGVDTLTREPLLPELHLDAFVLRAPIVECIVKPSRPAGQRAQDAFGDESPMPEDRGLRRRALIALGRQDVNADFLTPVDPRVQVLGMSSDHLVADVEEVRPAPRVGDVVEFIPGFASVLQAFTSKYVEKEYVGGPAGASAAVGSEPTQR
jgi:predicted amino acid racemase